MEETNMPSVAQTEEETTDLDTTEDVVESTESTEPETDWEAEAKKAKELADNYKVRAEKAERAAKTKTEVKPEVKIEAPSLKDYVALKNADIHEDDVEDVIEYAKFKKISISNALKSTVVKATLKEKEEMRTTAQATNTGKTRGGNSKVSGEALLEKASKTGEIPEDDKSLDEMLNSRYKR